MKHHVSCIAVVLLAVGQVNAQEPGTRTASTEIMIHTKPMSEDYESTMLEFPAHVSVSRDSDMCVEFYMINFTEEPVYYCGPPGRNTYYPWRMHLVRCDNGARVPYLDSGSRPLPRKEDGTLLKTGDGVLCRLPLKDAFGAENVPPGKYQLKIDYQVTGNLREWIDLGYSPGQFARTIMIIDVVDTKKSAGSSTWLLLSACIVAVCVVLGVWITRCWKMKTFQASKTRSQANPGPMSDTASPRSTSRIGNRANNNMSGKGVRKAEMNHSGILMLVAGLSLVWATAGKISAQQTVDTAGYGAKVSTPLEIAPIIRMEKSAKMVLRVRLRNTSGQPFRFFGGTRVPIGNLHFVLSKDGLHVPLLVTCSPPAAARNNVRALSADQSFVHSICLSDYGVDGKADNLPAGRYELRAEYSMGEKAVWVQEMGLTPVKIDELVAIIELAGGDEPASAGAGDGGAGIGILIVVILVVAGAVVGVARARRQRRQYG